MKLNARLTVALVATTACVAAPAQGMVKASDAKATHVYLKAKLVEQRTIAANEPAELKAVEALAAQVKAQCAGVLAGLPARAEGEAAQSWLGIAEEILMAGFAPAERVEHPAFARLAHVVGRLRWSNRKLTRLLRSLTREQAEQSAIAPPDLCADLRFWVASGYTYVSPGTALFLQRRSAVSSITRIEFEPGDRSGGYSLDTNALVAARLRPYESLADRRLARKALPRERTITDPKVRPFLEAVHSLSVALEQVVPA